jgi:hypothetical protein
MIFFPLNSKRRAGVAVANSKDTTLHRLSRRTAVHNRVTEDHHHVRSLFSFTSSSP